jgi:hypothetical protein
MPDYADKREARRRQSAVVLVIYVVVMIAVVALLASGALRIVLVCIFGIALAVNVIAMLRPVRPSKLVPLSPRIQSGVWPSSIRALSLPEVANGRGAGQFAELAGQVEFTATGVVWQPGGVASRGFGVGVHTWDPGWQICARRLPGLGSQAQVTLTHPDVPEPVTIWIRRASRFRID